MDYCVDGVACFIRSRTKESCSHTIQFEGRSVCICPVRCEVFEHYGV